MRPRILSTLVRWQRGLVTGLIVAFAGLGAWASVDWPAARTRGKPAGPSASPVSARPAPVRVEPTVSMPEALDPSRVREAVSRLEQTDTKSMSDFVHLLRLFGPEATVRVKGGGAPVRVLDLTFDSRKNRDFFGGRSSLIDTRDGVRCRTYDKDKVEQQPECQAHDGQLLAVLAELGVPLDRPLSTAGGPRTVGRLLDDALANFDLKVGEIEWLALAAALYVPPRSSWSDKFGKTCTFDDLANELIARPPSAERACAGTHLLYTLAVLFRADEQAPVLSPPVRARLRSYLEEMKSKALRTQAADGSWGVRWHEGKADGEAEAKPTKAEGKPVEGDGLRVLATGHQIEWMLLLPAEMLPPRESVLRAAGWLQAKLLAASEPTIMGLYCPYSHAGRVLLVLSRSSDLQPPGTAHQARRVEAPGAEPRRKGSGG